jgi:SAM-dependent methyltransferase
MPDPTKRFTNRVAFYVRARPKYPAALLGFFQSELGLSEKDTVADIGSGTGFLTELFVDNGNPTYAVEPNDAMRAAAEHLLGHSPNFHSINGSAEATTLRQSSIHFIAAGQAFHWFDPVAARKEFARILVPGGFVALVWNQRRLGESAFGRAYEELIERYRVDRSVERVRNLANIESAALKDFFAPSSFDTRTFDNPQLLDRPGLVDRLLSSSYMPTPSDSSYGELLLSANELFDAHQEDGKVLIAHDTHVYFGKLSA